MSASQIYSRIIQHPFASLVQGARLDSYQQNQHELVLQVQGFQPISSSLFIRDGKIYESVCAKHIPLRLTFSLVSKLKRDDFFTSLDLFSMDDPSRIIAYMYSWRPSGQRRNFYLFGLRLPIGADLEFFAENVRSERTGLPGKSFIVERDWSPAPPMPARRVPKTKKLYKIFGGDPISIMLDGTYFHRRLFIGGVNIQHRSRPQVDAVLNLSESPSRWIKVGTLSDPRDRTIEHGEGSHGMSVEDICGEAEWVIARLKQGQRVLVHCTAGMNRSVTVCCAVLILLEGLSASDALMRVRKFHPWARPDSHHWLVLRWLTNMRRRR